MTTEYKFDPTTHTHYIGGRPVEGVTTVLRDLIPGYSASEWYLQRGTAVHACAAMIGEGIEFEHDPQIDNQVQAIRDFFREVQPVVESVELPVSSPAYRYAGIADLVATVGGVRMVIDYKASFSAATPWQLAAYAMLMIPDVKVGMAVQIGADGKYRCSEHYELKRFKNEWLALLTAYRVRRACRVKEGK